MVWKINCLLYFSYYGIIIPLQTMHGLKCDLIRWFHPLSTPQKNDFLCILFLSDKRYNKWALILLIVKINNCKISYREVVKISSRCTHQSSLLFVWSLNSSLHFQPPTAHNLVNLDSPSSIHSFFHIETKGRKGVYILLAFSSTIYKTYVELRKYCLLRIAKTNKNYP